MQEKAYIVNDWPTWDDYKKAFLTTYQTADPAALALVKLHTIEQGKRDVINYITEFNCLCTQEQIPNYANNPHLILVFLKELNQSLEKAIAIHIPQGATLIDWQNAAKNWASRQNIMGQVYTNRNNHDDSNAMQVNALQTKQNECYNCRKLGHFAWKCKLPQYNQQRTGRGRGQGNRRNFHGQRGRESNWRNFQGLGNNKSAIYAQTAEIPRQESIYKAQVNILQLISKEEFAQMMKDVQDQMPNFQ
jgi:hypothetical protein